MTADASRKTLRRSIPVVVLLLLGVGLLIFYQQRHVPDAPPTVKASRGSSEVPPGATDPVSVGSKDPVESPDSNPAQNDSVGIPAEFQFAGVTRARLAASLDALLEHYTAEEQSVIKRFVGSVHDTAYLFDSKELLAWMVETGFPTPEDMLAAASMPYEALLEQAQAGNTKAAFFAVERWYAEREGMPATEDPLEGAAKRELEAATEAALLSGESPFVGYLNALGKRRSYPEDPGAEHGPLMWAALKGDTRATWGINGQQARYESVALHMNFMQIKEAELRRRGLLRLSPARDPYSRIQPDAIRLHSRYLAQQDSP